MKRREFISLTLGAATTAPFAVRAQQSGPMRRIGVLYFAGQDDGIFEEGRRAFAKALSDLGWREGQNLQIEYRWADADTSKVAALARELVDQKPDVLLALNTPSARALQQETRTIPIVFVAVGDPIGSGLVASFARPGGNITGFANMEASGVGKRIELLKTIVPRMTRVAAMFNPDSRIFSASAQQAFDEAARRHEVEPVLAPVRSEADITRTVTEIGASGANGLYINAEPFLGNGPHRDLIISLCAQHHVPAIYVFRFFVTYGGLISYGNDLLALDRQAAEYVARILKGATPADLPVQLPTKQELVVNLKTAKALNLIVPSSLLVSADEVIE
jgi:putative ABC transport system substrate-binding protein